MTEAISWTALLWCLLPVIGVAIIFNLWQGQAREVLLASARMLLQLLAVGYVLMLLFATPSSWLSLAILSFMLLVATGIALRPVRQHQQLWWPALISLGLAVSLHLILSIWLVIKVDPWYAPRIVIPLAGMYFANTMNSISLAVERYYAERQNQKSVINARNNAYHAAMIPQINGLLAVGLVALPGMMTGQILSGVSPLIAVRYQIMIMTMLLGTTGLGAALILWLLARRELSVNCTSGL